MKMRSALLALTVCMAGLASAQLYGPPKGAIPGESRVPANMSNAGVRIDQKLNDTIPMDIKFNTDKGEEVQIGSLFSERPVLMLMVFFECTGVCTQELNGLVDVVNRFRKEEDKAGELFDVIVVSIDPSETPKLAAGKKQAYLDLYEKKGTEDAWHFLTGKQENIAKLADAVGFKYKIEEKSGNGNAGNYQITHPAGLMVLTPHGQISKYFLSSEYDQYPLLESLRAAQRNQIGSRDDRPFFMACVNVDPMTGKMSMNILNSVKTGGILIMAIMAFAIFTMSRKYKTTPLSKDENKEDQG